MKISTTGYNVPFVDFTDTTITLDTQATVGTVDDFNKIMNLVENSGIVRGKFKIGSDIYLGTCICNPWANGQGIECVTITDISGSVSVLFMSLVLDGTAAKVTISLTAVGA